MSINCHNCRRPLSLPETESIEADPRILEVVSYFGQAACSACCATAARHNAELANYIKPSA